MPNFALSDYLQFIFSGISTGSIYALVALGFVTIYNVTGIINFAQGQFAMLGAMFAVTLTKRHLPLPAAFVLSVLIVTFIGALMERLTIHPARRSSIVTLIIITIGVDFALRGLALLAWGTTPYSLPAFSQGGALIVLGAVVSRQRLWIMGLTVLILVGLYFFFEHTLLGKAVRACAANRTAARLMGISPSRMSLFSFTLSAGLGAVGGIVIAPLTLVSYDMGLNLAIKGFVAAIMGGLVNTPGAVVGGMLLGVLESLTAGILTSGLKDAVAYVILFLVLFLRPGGIFGGQGGRGAGL